MLAEEDPIHISREFYCNDLFALRSYNNEPYYA